MSLEVNFKRLTDTAVAPTYAREGDAGMDLYADEDVLLRPGYPSLIRTGIALEIPDGYFAFVLPRSGLAIKKGLTLTNSPGLIDSGYRDEIKLIAQITLPHGVFNISRGDRIAQLLILPYSVISLVESGTLSESERGMNGFGSSGT